ncbi:uncharacterized protein I303_108628 [Kwoniella dejecticola CBS 10117]|uniref:Uncharacterized protein n=1 Tax=Kwoniella dejecticola CBS 10117 TaxID=1296121 RepID=A0A1A5ZWW2_9TREE|nr:uncharacterized protein I303_07047 [Kwoniella dejecticola CBS 10117]OBR82288.1 hypothetical protein I303_07047 [Kwoniella dejecticola CBS 10117]
MTALPEDKKYPLSKGNTSNFTPSPPPVAQEQETVQMMSREDVMVKLLEERQAGNKKKVIEYAHEDSAASNGFKADNGEHLKKVSTDHDRQDETLELDCIDGMLSPTIGEISMIEQQDDPMISKVQHQISGPSDSHQDDPSSTSSHRLSHADEDEIISTPLSSDEKQDYPIVNPANSGPPPSTHHHSIQDPAEIALPVSSPSTQPPPPPLPSLESSTKKPKATSPMQRFPIPNRRPKGWISSLSHPRAVSSLNNQVLHFTPPRSSSTSDVPHSNSDPIEPVSAHAPRDYQHQLHNQYQHPARGRLSSVRVDQQHASGRRVSGAMQYAFQLQSAANIYAHQSGEEESEGHGSDGNEDGGEIDDNGDGPYDGALGSESIQALSPSEEARIRYEVGLSQDQDEVWMEYVRNQLSALFPDFFGADPAQLANIDFAPYSGAMQGGVYGEYDGVDENVNEDEDVDEGEYQEGSIDGSVIIHRGPSGDYNDQEDMVRTNDHRQEGGHNSPSIGRGTRDRFGLGNQDVFSTPNDRSLTTTSSTDISSLPTPPLRSNAEMLRGNVVLPNVRDEFSGLREEIERLRSFVGGLAVGLSQERDTQEEVNDPDVQEEERAQAEEREQQEGRVVSESTNSQEEMEVEERENGDRQVAEERPFEDGRATQENGNQNGSTEEEGSDRSASNAEKAMEAVQSSVGMSKTNDRPEQVISEAFSKTAHKSAEILRLLDSLVHPPTPRDGSQDKDDVIIESSRTDEMIFAEGDLERIKEWVVDRLKV